MHGRLTAALAGLAALALVGVPGAASAAGFNCRSPWLQPAEKAICADARLSRIDEKLARRLLAFTRRLTFGQYLGLRYWHERWRDKRIACNDERRCLVATYRAQNRLLDRFDLCLDTSARRRTCLRATLDARQARARRRR